MLAIIDRLYLGNREMAKDNRRLRENGVTHIVNCAEELPNYHPREFKYLSLKLKDPDPGLATALGDAIRFIDEGRAGGGALVHCFAGVSRSPAVILAYLCHHHAEPLESAARRLAHVIWTNPDLLFLSQVAAYFGQPITPEEAEAISRILTGRPSDC
jgi:protein-tyrosine phosphatase